MDEIMKPGNGEELKEGGPGDLSRRRFFKVAGISALAYPLLIDTARADDIASTTLKAMEKQYADVTISDEEANAFAPFMDFFTKGIRRIEISEEVEPAIVFRRRKEK
jgi:hypothetical protein